MVTIIQIINLLFVTYTVLIFIRIFGSWFQSLAQSQFMRFVYQLTEPYLGLFRRFIPPIGGMIDISPMVALIALSILKTLLIRLLI